eukprot:CAMPEP_0178900124 /NCGR_PEP_ID=MMETSP0786-20121207/3297_1 /TAXON_ID=186022 /ORGANISM="Thalassionema frauenfeldii, Strain CCMP 1798" /LENGTH=121 /DNA_ID=CAMNT_0020571089 /DNA_START=206 /DNA_END=568 /DNA_ORIENTATION=+
MAPNHSDDEGTHSEEDSEEVDDNEEEDSEEEEEEEETAKPAPKKRKGRKKKKDPKKPKRNMSACFLYFQASRPQVRAENPDAKFADIVSNMCRLFGFQALMSIFFSVDSFGTDCCDTSILW